FGLASAPEGKYQAIIVCVGHKEYLGMKESDFQQYFDGKGLLVDLKGLYRNKMEQVEYWSL
ncbi:MAG: nucleotide sugar dehydrogenase, partial [Flavobacteriales bacterium]|nr:nucleotide sugar dehydrogenase [Flavobacteriales bacterium]